MKSWQNWAPCQSNCSQLVLGMVAYWFYSCLFAFGVLPARVQTTPDPLCHGGCQQLPMCPRRNFITKSLNVAGLLHPAHHCQKTKWVVRVRGPARGRRWHGESLFSDVFSSFFRLERHKFVLRAIVAQIVDPFSHLSYWPPEGQVPCLKDRHYCRQVSTAWASRSEFLQKHLTWIFLFGCWSVECTPSLQKLDDFRHCINGSSHLAIQAFADAAWPGLDDEDAFFEGLAGAGLLGQQSWQCQISTIELLVPHWMISWFQHVQTLNMTIDKHVYNFERGEITGSGVKGDPVGEHW